MGDASEILLTLVSELTNENYIDVPLAEGVDMTALTEGDSDPLFVTLPIGAAGKSRNGRVYDADSVRRIEESVNRDKPGGIKGHMKPEDRATRFDLPSLMWVGAKRGADGRVYGKAYIPTYAADVREYVKKQKARRAPVATSIYGTAKMQGGAVRELQIEAVDLADPARAGMQAAVAVPQLTSEMNEDGNEMSEELISELRDQRKQAETERDEARQTIAELNAKVAELQPTAETLAAIGEMVSGEDVVAEIRTMVSEMQALKRATLVNDIRAYVDEKVKVPAAKALVLEHVGIGGSEIISEMVPADIDAAQAKVDAYLEAKKDIIKALTVAEMGPGALVGGEHNRPTDGRKLDDSEDAQRRKKSLYG